MPLIHPGTDTAAGVVACDCPGMMLLILLRPEAGTPLTKLPAWCWMRLAMSLYAADVRWTGSLSFQTLSPAELVLAASFCPPPNAATGSKV